MNERECPADEVCSSETPRGLDFQGDVITDLDLFGSASLRATAVGGWQTFVLHRIGPPGSGVFAQPFRVAFEPGIFRTQSVAPPSVTVEALHAGSSLMRILEPESDALFDRVTLEAYAVERATLAPFDLSYDGAEAWSVSRDPDLWLIARLYGEGLRLVDERLAMEVRDASDNVVAAQEAWDMLELRGPLLGTSLSIRMDSPSVSSLSFVLPIEDAVDELRVTEEPVEPVRSGARSEVSFGAIAHAGTPDERRIYGMRWTYSVTGPVELDLVSRAIGWGNIAFRATGAGTATITAEVAGASIDYTFSILPSE